jgi:hypothetical protein
MTAAVDADPCALVATAADIICSLRGADLAGWTPPWRKPADDDGRERLAWPSVARGKRSRSRRGSSPSAGSADATKKKKRARRAARGSPPSPLDYSAGSGASTSGGDDGAFCSPPVVLSSSAGGAGVVTHVEPVNSKVRVLVFPCIASPFSCCWCCRRSVAFRCFVFVPGLEDWTKLPHEDDFFPVAFLSFFPSPHHPLFVRPTFSFSLFSSRGLG